MIRMKKRDKNNRTLKFNDIVKIDDYNLANYKVSLVFYVVITTLIGIIVIGSADKSTQGSQIVGFVLGLFVMVFVSLIDYKFYSRVSIFMYIVGIVLLALVAVAGSSAGGAERWLIIGPIRFQPSEIVKIFLIVFFSIFF